MTTKDQAIAWYSQTPKKTRVTQINMDGEDGWMPLFPKPPAPDCRTCERRYPEVDGAYGGYTNKCDMKCTNGDQYQPAPKVVLWRTE